MRNSSLSPAERFGNILGAIAFIMMGVAPLVALVAWFFFNYTATGDSLLVIAQFLLYTGLAVAMIRGAYDICYVNP